MLLRLWCKATHKRVTIPFRGYYTCLTCLRRFKVAWEVSVESGKTHPRRNRDKPEVEYPPCEAVDGFLETGPRKSIMRAQWK